MNSNTTINPIISICVTTYNLEKYISIALDSFLNQKTEFSYEIVICDDKSEDNTIDIINSYIKKYPTMIRLFEAEKNLGMLPNFIKSLNVAKGKYIAVCDGDDYWIDEYKLQKQVSFLEKNHEFSACYANSFVINQETGEKNVAKLHVWDEANSDELLFHDDFRKDNVPLSPGHISAFVFRNVMQNNYPIWFYEVDGVTDFPLYMMLSKFGKAKFINEQMSVYRIHPKSTSTVEYEHFRFLKGRINMYNHVNQFLDKKYNSIISKLIAKHQLKIAKSQLRRKNIAQFLFIFLRVFISHPRLIFNMYLR